MSDPSTTEQQQREQRNNTVFGNVPGIQTLSRAEAAKKDLGIDIPTYMVPLPSAGKVYPPGSPLHNKEEIEIKEMTTQEEDILMSRALIKKGTVITELIRSCLMDPAISVTDILSGDRNALMVAIRISGYGSEYKFQVKCPQCEVQQDCEVNLSNLEIKPLTITPSEPGANKFVFDLPSSKKRVEFKFLTGKEEEEILAISENKKKKGIMSENIITTRLFYSMISVGGETDRSIIAKFSQYMSAKDSRALRNYIDKYEPGIDMRHPFECKNCAHREEVAVSISVSFFWPNSGS